MSEFRLNPLADDCDELEHLLAGLRPQASGVSRDRLMFLVGHSAARNESRTKSSRLWPLATAASWAMTAGVLGMWMMQSADVGARRVAVTAPQSIIEQPVAPREDRAATAPVVAITKVNDHSPSDQRFAPAADLMLDDLLEDRLLSTRFTWRDRQFGGLNSSAGELDSQTAATSDVPAKPAAPATYARLMELYIHESFGEGGGRL